MYACTKQRQARIKIGYTKISDLSVMPTVDDSEFNKSYHREE